MNELEISFGESPWEQYLMNHQMGDTISAARLLTLLEDEPETAVDAALEAVETACMELDVSDLPVFLSGEAALRLRQERELVQKGLNRQDLAEGDPLRLYLEEVAAMPHPHAEAALADACARGDEKAREELTRSGLQRVVALAAEQVGRGVLLLDLIQEGSLGLWQGVQSYRHGDYAAHRDRWIRLYLAKAIFLQARADGVGQKMRTAVEDYRAVDQQLLGDLGRNPTGEEMAQALHMTSDETETVRKALENAQILARVKEPPQQEETEEQAVEDTAYFQMRQRISELLAGLSEQDVRVLTLRFGLEGGLPLSPEDTGRRLGLTPQEVLSREAKALESLRNT